MLIGNVNFSLISTSVVTLWRISAMRLLPFAFLGLSFHAGVSHADDEVDPWQNPYAYWDPPQDSNSVYATSTDYQRQYTPYPVHVLSNPGVAAALFFTGVTVSTSTALSLLLQMNLIKI